MASGSGAPWASALGGGAAGGADSLDDVELVDDEVEGLSRRRRPRFSKRGLSFVRTSSASNMFNPATLFMYVPVPSQEPVIQWLSFVYVLHICFSFIFFT